MASHASNLAQGFLLQFPQNLVLFAAILCSLAYVYLFGGPLGKIPGPFTAALSRLWMIFHSWNGDMHRTMINLHKKHGKLVRTGPNEVSVSDLSAIRTIYGEITWMLGAASKDVLNVNVGAGTKFTKSDWYSVWQGHRKFDLFAERNEKVHGSQRRLVSRIYSMDSLKDLEKYVDDAILHFLSKMGHMGGQSVDMGLWVQLFAFGKSALLILMPATETSRCHWGSDLFETFWLYGCRRR